MSKYRISEALRSDIISKRKELKISSQELSARVGMSKFWLPSVERGKTSSSSDIQIIINIYKILLNTEDEELIKLYINNISVPKNDSPIPISNDIVDIPDDELNDNITDSIYDLETVIADSIISMENNNKRVLLMGIRSLIESFYESPELTSLLLNIPMHGVNPHSNIEKNIAKTDLMTLYDKYVMLSEKNANLKDISNENKKKMDALMYDMEKRYLDNAGKSIVIFISELYEQFLKKSNNSIITMYDIERFYCFVVDNLKNIWNDIDDILPAIDFVENGIIFYEIITRSIKLYNSQCSQYELEELDISESKMKLIERYLTKVKKIR